MAPVPFRFTDALRLSSQPMLVSNFKFERATLGRLGQHRIDRDEMARSQLVIHRAQELRPIDSCFCTVRVGK